MAEKILARTSGRDSVVAGEYVTARPDVLMCHEAFATCGVALRRLGVERLADPDRVYVILDHFFPAPTEAHARAHSIVRSLVEQYEVGHDLGHQGICHQVMVEGGHVEPGQLVLGTDSHSTTYGAVGAAGAGIGTTEMTYVLALGELWFQVPPTVRFDLRGEPGPASCPRTSSCTSPGASAPTSPSTRRSSTPGRSPPASGSPAGWRWRTWAPSWARSSPCSPRPTAASGPTPTPSTTPCTRLTSPASSPRSPGPTTRATWPASARSPARRCTRPSSAPAPTPASRTWRSRPASSPGARCTPPPA